MRRALLVALAALLMAPVALGAPPPRRAEAAEPEPPAVAGVAPAPAAAPAAAPAVTAAPLPPRALPPAASAAAASASPPCCDSLAAAGFKPSPGMPVIILTTKTKGSGGSSSSSSKRLDSRTKAPVEICACGTAGGDGGGTPSSSSSSSSAISSDLQVPGLARVRGGVNTQRYNSIKQFAIYPVLGTKDKRGGSEGGEGNETSAAAAAAATEAAPPSSSPSSTFVGLPRAKQFVLIGQVNDTFSLKYWTGLELARRMVSAAGDPSDALIVPQARQVELFVVDDGAPLAFAAPSSQHYRGVYLLTQHINPALIPAMKEKKNKKSSKKSSDNAGNETVTTATATAESETLSAAGGGKGGGKRLAPGAFISTFLHGERIDPDFSAFVEMPLSNRWAGKNKEWAVKYPDSKDVQKLGTDGRSLIDSVAKRYAAVEDAIFARGALSPADFDSPEKVMKMGSSGSSAAAQVDAEAFEKVAHLPSWLDWFLLAEFTKVTKHAYHSAAFMHSLGDDEDARLRFGPAWSYGQGMGTCCGYPVEGFKDSGRASSGNASSPAATGFSGGGGTTASGFLFTLCLVEGRCPSLDGYDRGNGFSPWFVALFFGGPSSSPSPPSAPSPFACAAAERWLGLRRGPWSDASLRGMMAGRVSLLSSGPGERALARWPALAAAATEAAGATAAAAAAAAAAGGKEGGGARETNTLVAAVGGTIERWLLERAEWLDGAFEQASGDATRGRAYPASYAA